MGWAYMAIALFGIRCLLKIEKLLELFVECDAEDEGEFCCGVELPCFDRADGVPGHAGHFGELRLGEAPLPPGLPE